MNPGDKINKLRLIEFTDADRHGYPCGLFICECGFSRKLRIQSVTSGLRTACKDCRDKAAPKKSSPFSKLTVAQQRLVAAILKSRRDEHGRPLDYKRLPDDARSIFIREAIHLARRTRDEDVDAEIAALKPRFEAVNHRSYSVIYG